MGPINDDVEKKKYSNASGKLRYENQRQNYSSVLKTKPTEIELDQSYIGVKNCNKKAKARKLGVYKQKLTTRVISHSKWEKDK